MPIHSRITSINSFSTAKTERVPIVSEYIEDYFNVKTNKDYEIATAYEGNNMYKIEADSECVKLRCGLV